MTEAVHQGSGQSGQTHQSGGVIRAIAFICLAHPSVRWSVRARDLPEVMMHSEVLILRPRPRGAL